MGAPFEHPTIYQRANCPTVLADKLCLGHDHKNQIPSLVIKQGIASNRKLAVRGTCVVKRVYSSMGVGSRGWRGEWQVAPGVWLKISCGSCSAKIAPGVY